MSMFVERFFNCWNLLIFDPPFDSGSTGLKRLLPADFWCNVIRKALLLRCDLT